MNTRWISCNACGADAFRQLSSVGEWNIGTCGKCGLIYLNPAPFFDPTPEFSAMSKGFQYTRYMHEQISPKIFDYESEQLRIQQQEIHRLTGQALQAVRYLEIGCGSGASVRAAADLGWKATGIDIDPELIQTGVKQHGADLRCTPLMQGGFGDGSFEFIRLRDVIEHLPDPFESLLEIRRLALPRRNRPDRCAERRSAGQSGAASSGNETHHGRLCGAPAPHSRVHARNPGNDSQARRLRDLDVEDRCNGGFGIRHVQQHALGEPDGSGCALASGQDAGDGEFRGGMGTEEQGIGHRVKAYENSTGGKFHRRAAILDTCDRQVIGPE